MMQSRSVQIWVGLFVIAGMAALLMLAMKVSNIRAIRAFSGEEGYAITARFENIGGLKVRSPVTMAGVVVGRVSKIGFDKEI